MNIETAIQIVQDEKRSDLGGRSASALCSVNVLYHNFPAMPGLEGISVCLIALIALFQDHMAKHLPSHSLTVQNSGTQSWCL